jgi:hypothetical protein
LSYESGLIPRLYEIVTLGTDPRRDVEFYLYTFEHGRDTIERLRAGFRLKHIAANLGGTPGIYDAARTVLAEPLAHQELTVLAADILVAAGAEGGNPERYLLGAHRRIEDLGLQRRIGWILIENAALEPDPRRVLLGYSEDESLYWGYRHSLLERERHAAAEGAELPDDIETRVRRIARSADHLQLRREAADVLKAHGRPRPLRAILEDEDYQKNVFAAIYIPLVLGSIVLFFIGIVGFTAQGRGGAVLGWLAFSAWMLVAFLIGLVSSIGHNYGPPLRQIVAGNMLLFLSFPLYAMAAINAFRRRHDPPPREPAAAGLP